MKVGDALVSLVFEYLALPQVYTFLWWGLYVCPAKARSIALPWFAYPTNGEYDLHGVMYVVIPEVSFVYIIWVRRLECADRGSIIILSKLYIF